jgi:predicted HicB family RNase H-like nuclease
MKSRILQEHLSAEYPIVIVKKEDGYLGWFPDFGRITIKAFASTISEVISDLEESKRFLIEDLVKNNLPIPRPSDEEANSYSGQFVLRIPRTLHGKLSDEAKQNGVSLNTYISYLLSERHIQARVNSDNEQLNHKLDQITKTLRESKGYFPVLAYWPQEETQKYIEPKTTIDPIPAFSPDLKTINVKRKKVV